MKLLIATLIGLSLGICSSNLAQTKKVAAKGYSNPSLKSTKGKTEIKVFLVDLDDNGKTGKKIGCDDSLIAVKRIVKSTVSPLRAAIEELLSIPRDYNEKLGNYWANNNLKIKTVSISKGVALIRFTGEGPSIAGICDEPRVTSQIVETAKQFSTVKRVKVFINNETLESAIR